MFFGKPKVSEDISEGGGIKAEVSAVPQQVIFDADMSNFESRVLQASIEKPVIAYFTAPWCEPCKQLGPVMEAAVQAAGGAVLLAKINIDDNQELAAAMRIQSVPSVLMFFQGRPIDAFQGAVLESEIKSFIDKAIQAARQAQPDALDIPEALKGAAQALADKEYGAAQAIYAQVLEQDNSNVQAFVGLVRTYIAAGHMEEAQAMVENAPEDIAKNPSFSEARTALELAQNQPSGKLSELEKAVSDRPDDYQVRFDLALGQFAADKRKEALDNLLEIMSRDREWNEEAARHQILKFFEAMGHGDPLTIEYRRKLSTILFS